MIKQRKKTERPMENFRYVCPRCHKPTIQPATLPIVDFMCPNTKKIVTKIEINAGFQLDNPYEKIHSVKK